MNDSGYIRIYRQIRSWEWFQDANTLLLYLYILLSVNYTDGSFKGEPVKRGQMVTSLPSLSTGTGLSIRQVRTALEHLKTTGEVTDEISPRGRVITVLKYDDYQIATDNLTGKRQANDTQLDRQTTDNLTGERQQYNNNNKNIRKEEEKKEKKNKVTASGGDERFDLFWATYPRREAKQDARKAFDKLAPDDALMAKILDAIRKQSQSQQWQENGGRFIPYPATWLNSRRWEDDVQPAKPAPSYPQKMAATYGYSQRDYSQHNQDEGLAMMMAMMQREDDV